MRFICLGYADTENFEKMSPDELGAFMDDCFAYDKELLDAGHFVAGEALMFAEHGVSLTIRGGQVSVTDGPFVETKEQLGGILIIEARDLNHAISLMSKHPGVRGGRFEIRPANLEVGKLFKEKTGSSMPWR